MKKLCAIAVAIVAGFALVPTLEAESPIKGLYLDQNLQAGYNPVGAQLVTKLYYRLPLPEGEGILWESAKIDVGLANSLSPAYDFVGAFVDIEPIAIFDLELKAQRAVYFDALGYGFQDLGGYGSDFSASALSDLPDGNSAGWILSAAPTLKMAVGRLAFSNTLHVNYFDVGDGHGYFYETYGNCVLAKRDLELFNDAYLLWSFVRSKDRSVMAGLNESILGVPNSGYRSQILEAVGVLSDKLSDRLSFYGALTAGIYLEDENFRGKPRVSGIIGAAYRLR